MKTLFSELIAIRKNCRVCRISDDVVQVDPLTEYVEGKVLQLFNAYSADYEQSCTGYIVSCSLQGV